MKNLENYGVQTLNAQEIRETEGGISPYQDFVHEHYDDPVTSFVAGFIAGFFGF